MKALLIGKFAEITTKKRRYVGKIIRETQNTLTIRTDRGEKTFIKDEVSIKIGNTSISGRDIKTRPEDRIKK